jgi:hypothetical protein
MWDVFEKYIPEQDINGIKKRLVDSWMIGMILNRHSRYHCESLTTNAMKFFRRGRKNVKKTTVIRITENINELDLMTEICVSEDENDSWDDGSSLGQSGFAGTPIGFGCLIDYDFSISKTSMSKTSI